MAYYQLAFLNGSTAVPGVYTGTANLWHNDEVKAFMIANNFPTNYNDGLLAFFRDVYATTKSNLPDLMARYRKQYGDTLPPP